ncbi:restriction endonuclease subunit S [Peribacillus frigoritolerans]|uniref:restriction endonuclease subunit S n=1 Tax=Peribacillus frigoritolerans TaxID=450367 RepID=UPI002E1B027C|nr:restriction endonuclease subunit S [Peribacillus frigoritolerans]MED3847479.1 restriction endonuclease subunit S [Peribacillus frigoritolerans]
MKSNYKRLGDYIREINIRNTNLEDVKLLGVSIQKVFMPSIANTIGTNMSTYKLIKKGQFAYGPVTSRNGDKISVALLDDYEKAMISQAYTSFEVIDENQLLSEYLMMWFRRPEFDRYARFMSHGSAREIFGWEEMCNTALPVPSITKQKQIVKEYNVLVDRINLNNDLIKKLEETTQAIYKQWFVDFEFPDANGKLYKSNGGYMEFNKELDKEIPKGWEVISLSTFCEISSSKRIFESEYKNEGIPFYRGGEISQKKEGTPIEDTLYISEERYKEVIEKSGKPICGDILMTAVGTLGVSYLVQEEEFYFKDGNVIWFKNFKEHGSNYYLYDFFQSDNFTDILSEITIGSTQNAITIKTLGEQIIITPPLEVIEKYNEISSCLNGNIVSRKNMNLKIHELRNTLLSKLPTLEDSL